MNAKFKNLAVCAATLALTASGNALAWMDDPLNTRPPVLDLGAASLPGDTQAAPCGPGQDFHAATPPNGEQALTLATAVDLALCNNPRIASTWAAIKIQAGALGEAQAQYLPTINFGIGHSVDKTRYPGTSIDATDTESDTNNAALNWRLFDFGGRSASEAAANASLQSALAGHDANLQKSLGSVISAYFDAQSAQATLNARLSQEELARLTVQAATRKEARGSGSQSDTLQAATALAKATLERSRSSGAFNKALAALAYAIGLPSGVPLHLADDAPDLPKVTDASGAPDSAGSSAANMLLQADLAQWLKQVQAHHPAIKAAKFQVDAAEQKVKVAQSDGRPTVDFGVSYFENGRPNQALSPSTQETLSSVTLNIPVFSGFSNTYKVRGAQAQVEQAQAQLHDVEQQTLSDALQAHADATAALDNLAASVDLLSAAQAALESLQRKFERGAADILELLSTQSALADAQLERVRVLADWRSARLRLLAATGVLGRKSLLGE